MTRGGIAAPLTSIRKWVSIVACAVFAIAIAIGIAIAIDGFFGSAIFDSDCDPDSDTEKEPQKWYRVAVRYLHGSAYGKPSS